MFPHGERIPVPGAAQHYLYWIRIS